MEKQFHVIGSGYVSMDHLIKIAPPAQIGFTSLISNRDHHEIYYGGCSSNICCLLNTLGSTAIPILRVGRDWKTNGYKDYLSNAKVPLDAVHEIPDEITSSSYIIEDDSGNHITLFYPGAMDGRYAKKVDDVLFRQSRYALMTAASREDNEMFYRQCRENRVPLVLSMKMDVSAFQKSSLYDFLCYSSIIFTNENEQNEIVNLFGLEAITDFFNLGNTEVIVVTLGKRGSRYFFKKNGSIEEGHVDACPVEGKVVDRTGAGDAYVAGFLYGYVREKTPAQCCGLGSACSSFIIEKMGCTTNAPSETNLIRRYEAWRDKTQ